MLVVISHSTRQRGRWFRGFLQSRADSFNWGGFTAVNWLRDSTGLYTLGHVPGGDVWSIHEMGADLDVVSTRTFTATALGYAFLIDGKLFTSSSFDSNVVDRVLDFATGAAASVDFRIDNLGAAYLSNTFYDPIQDRLYLQNSADSTLFSIDSASVAFRARAVPEPASVAMLGSGLLAVLAVARRRGARAPADRA